MKKEQLQTAVDRASRATVAVVLVVTVLAAWPTGVVLGAEGPARFWLVTDVQVLPGEKWAYEQALARFIDVLELHGFRYPLRIRVTDDSRVSWISPLGSPREIDDWEQELERVRAEIGEQWLEIFAPLRNAGVENASELYRLRRDLSYLPDAPRVTDDEPGYQDFWHCFVARGQSEQFSAAMRDWAELYAEHSARDGFFVIEKVRGAQRPHFIVIHAGTSAADAHGWLERLKQACGKSYEELMRRTSATLRATERVGSWSTGLRYQPSGASERAGA